VTHGSRKWIVYACRSAYVAEVAETIWRRKEEIGLLVDNLEGDPDDIWISDFGAPVVGPERLEPGDLDLPAVVPLLTPGFRWSVEAEARGSGLRSFPELLDPTATVARTSSVAEGSVLNVGVVVGARSVVGRFVHVNRTASVGHDNSLEDFATIGPGSVLAGHVHIGRGAFVGAGAVLAPEVRVGANAVIGAGAVVVRDVEPGTVVVGNPARVLRSEGSGYGGSVVPA
jgi:sugar O-acyltransferase (sialic acid O-acetyltransferase NeuD family)